MELAIGEARRGVAVGTRFPGMLDVGDNGREGLFENGECVAHYLGHYPHADDAAEELVQLVYPTSESTAVREWKTYIVVSGPLA